MQPMEAQADGMDLNPSVLIQTQNNIIAQNAVRLVQMEAAIQQLRLENQNLRGALAQRDDYEVIEEEPDADTGTD